MTSVLKHHCSNLQILCEIFFVEFLLLQQRVSGSVEWHAAPLAYFSADIEFAKIRNTSPKLDDGKMLNLRKFCSGLLRISRNG